MIQIAFKTHVRPENVIFGRRVRSLWYDGPPDRVRGVRSNLIIIDEVVDLPAASEEEVREAFLNGAFGEPMFGVNLIHTHPVPEVRLIESADALPSMEPPPDSELVDAIEFLFQNPEHADTSEITRRALEHARRYAEEHADAPPYAAIHIPGAELPTMGIDRGHAEQPGLALTFPEVQQVRWLAANEFMFSCAADDLLAEAFRTSGTSPSGPPPAEDIIGLPPPRTPQSIIPPEYRRVLRVPAGAFEQVDMVEDDPNQWPFSFEELEGYLEADAATQARMRAEGFFHQRPQQPARLREGSFYRRILPELPPDLASNELRAIPTSRTPDPGAWHEARRAAQEQMQEAERRATFIPGPAWTGWGYVDVD